MAAKKVSPWHAFIANRQTALEKHHARYPEHPFYGPKAIENGALNKLYETPIGPDHEAFFKMTQGMYVKFAAGMDELETLVKLPYAAGDNVTLADLHMVPWFAHSLAGVGTSDPEDFGKLEAHIRKTVPRFEIGAKTREWWGNFGKRESFREVFATLH